MKVAIIFPGQGAQRVGMGRDLFDSSPAARQIFEEADAALDEPLSKLIFEGPADQLTLTANTQPAILTVSIAALRAIQERVGSDLAPLLTAGHSLGEFSALVAASAMGFADAVRTTRARGTFMQEAVPAGRGAMAAVIGKSAEEVTAACAGTAGDGVVSPANFNTPTQIVISGDADAVKRASQTLAAEGAKVIPLKVSAPFHCSLMAPAATQLDGFLADIPFSDPTVPVVSNVEARPNRDGARVRPLLVEQVTSSVRWTESVRTMVDQGVEIFLELGPGNVLAGLIRKIEASAKIVSLNSVAGLDKAAAALEEEIISKA